MPGEGDSIKYKCYDMKTSFANTGAETWHNKLYCEIFTEVD